MHDGCLKSKWQDYRNCSVIVLSEPAQAWASPQYSSEAHHGHSFLTSTRPYAFNTPFFPSLFNSKSIELLTWSGEVLVCAIILKVGEQGDFMGLFTCMGLFRFRVTLLHLYNAFHYHMGPFHPRETTPPPVGGFVGGLRRLCVLLLLSFITPRGNKAEHTQ